MGKFIEKYQDYIDYLQKCGYEAEEIDAIIKGQVDDDRIYNPSNVLDLDAYKEWQLFPEEEKEKLLTAYCPVCEEAIKIKDGFSIRRDKKGLIINGKCPICRTKIVKCHY